MGRNWRIAAELELRIGMVLLSDCLLERIDMAGVEAMAVAEERTVVVVLAVRLVVAKARVQAVEWVSADALRYHTPPRSRRSAYERGQERSGQLV